MGPEREGRDRLDIEECELQGLEFVARRVVGLAAEDGARAHQVAGLVAPQRLIDLGSVAFALADEEGGETEPDDQDEQNQHLPRRE